MRLKAKLRKFIEGIPSTKIPFKGCFPQILLKKFLRSKRVKELPFEVVEKILSMEI